MKNKIVKSQDPRTSEFEVVHEYDIEICEDVERKPRFVFHRIGLGTFLSLILTFILSAAVLAELTGIKELIGGSFVVLLFLVIWIPKIVEY